MKLYISTDTNSFVTSPLFPAPIDSVEFKRGDSATVEIVFVKDNEAVTATSGKQIVFAIKEKGKYDADYLVSADTYTTSGVSYILKPSFNTVSLNDLLNSGDSNDANDVASVDAMLEVTWSDDSGANWLSSNTITAKISNDVVKGSEATPAASATLLEWLETYRPLPLELFDSVPVDSQVETVTFTLSGGTIVDFLPVNSTLLSSDGNGSNTLGADWWCLTKDFGTPWTVTKYDGTGAVVATYTSTGTQHPYNPAGATWTPHTLSATWNDYTPGVFGQLAINQTYVGDFEIYTNVLSDSPRAKWILTN